METKNTKCVICGNESDKTICQKCRQIKKDTDEYRDYIDRLLKKVNKNKQEISDDRK